MTRVIFISVAAAALIGATAQAQPRGSAAGMSGAQPSAMNSPSTYTPALRMHQDRAGGMGREMAARPQGDMPAMEFAHMAAQSDRFEREGGVMARRRGHDPRVRQFGERMIRDHLRTEQAMTRALMRAHMRVAPTPQLNDQQQQMLTQFREASPRDFDRIYIDGQVQAHQQALQMLQEYANGGSVPALRQAAAQAVPIVQSHFRMAEEIRASLR